MKMNLKKVFTLRNSKGFTLIELLVVVAIIGILASVVLASLNTARAKGADAAVKANLDNMRAQAAIFYDNNSNKYTTGVAAAVTCSITTAGSPTGCTDLFADATMLSGLKAAALASGATLYANIDSTAQLWAAEAGLKATASTSWCVDSAGKSELVNAAVASPATACP